MSVNNFAADIETIAENVEIAKDAFTEMQISIVEEIKEAKLNLLAGKQEVTYRILQDLEDELVTDINISNAKEPSDTANVNA